MIIPFNDIRHLIPAYIFNEYGQLTGNFVYSDQIVCESPMAASRYGLTRKHLRQKTRSD